MHQPITIDQLAARCDRVRWNGRDSFTACCIAHDDRSPSMSVSQNGDKLLMHCHSGCTQEELLHAAGIRALRDPIQAIERPRPRARLVIDTSATEAKARKAVQLATLAPDNHDYLVKKGIQPHGVGVLGELYEDLPSPVRNRGNVLVIPMADVNGEVLSCQFIAEDGSKAYMAGSKRRGGFYYIEGNDRLWICEGFATGASLHEDTGDSVACAFDAGSLMPVTNALTALYGLKREILLMADDDWSKPSNTGINKAREASQANGIKMVVPDFTGLARRAGDSDYNDMKVLRNG